MTELADFPNLDLAGFAEEKAKIASCRMAHLREAKPNCKDCALVLECEKIKNFVELQFNIGLNRLQSCQQSNGVKSCSECDLFFGCENRKFYVASVYEKLNEGHGGEFDF